MMYVDDTFANFTMVNTISAKTLSAPSGDNLSLGASSNLIFESMVGTTIRAPTIKMYQTTYSNSTRIDTEYVRLFLDSNNSTSVITSVNSNAITLTSQDANKTVTMSGMTLCNDNTYQYISTSASRGFFIDGGATQTRNVYADGQIFCKHYVLWKTFDTASNAGDTTEVGYTFRLNSNDQLELIKYGKVLLADGSSKSILRRIAVMGAGGITSTTSTDSSVSTYDPITNLSYLTS